MFGTRPENAPEPKELFAKAREMYENGRENRKIPVNLRLSVRRGEPVRLSGACAVHGGAAFAVDGAVPEEARNRAVTAEELRQRLSKTGGTVFTADRIEIELDEGLTIPASAVNGLRRELLEELAKRRMDIPPRRKLPALPLPDAPEGGQAMRFTCSVQKAEQVTAALLAEKPAAVYVPVEELERLDPELDWGETELCAVLPRIFRTADEALLRRRLEQHPEASAVAIGNLGHLPIVRGLNRTLRGDFGLNIFNSRALLFWQGQELASATVSFELRWQQVRRPPEVPALRGHRLRAAAADGDGELRHQMQRGLHPRGRQRPHRPYRRTIPCALRLRLPVRDPEQQDAVPGRQAGNAALRPDLWAAAVHYGDTGAVRAGAAAVSERRRLGAGGPDPRPVLPRRRVNS